MEIWQISQYFFFLLAMNFFYMNLNSYDQWVNMIDLALTNNTTSFYYFCVYLGGVWLHRVFAVKVYRRAKLFGKFSDHNFVPWVLTAVLKNIFSMLFSRMQINTDHVLSWIVFSYSTVMYIV